MSDLLTEARFWLQVIGDSKRTVVCAPDLESRIKGWIDARGMGGLIAIHALRACPENKILLIDEGAIEASFAQSLTRRRR